MVGAGFLHPPQALERAAKRIVGKYQEDQQTEELNHRVTVIGEIVSATGFHAQQTYITYQLLLPEQGWIYEDANDYELEGITRDDTCEFNKRHSVTQVSTGRVDNSQDPEDEDTTKFTSHFCFPFDYQFLAKEVY